MTWPVDAGTHRFTIKIPQKLSRFKAGAGYNLRPSPGKMKISRFLEGRVPAKMFSKIFLGSLIALSPAISLAAPASVSYSNAPSQIEAYDFVEITATVLSPDAHDPFEDATLTGTLATEVGGRHWDVDGFCDADNGSVFRIRFMAPQPGGYKYTVTYRQGGFQKTATGTFQAIDAHRRGTIGVDPKYPWHFIWGGTGEHYFFNGTTAYWLVGWRDEHTIQYSIDRLARLKVNRLRVTIAGRERIFLVSPSWSARVGPSC
jgi:hypothetical protein